MKHYETRTTIMEIPKTDKLIRGTEVRRLLGGISRTTLWRRVKDGSIPKPIKIGNGTTSFWKESWIYNFIEGK